jgi:putative transposase
MPRRLRNATGGIAYHVLNRAVGRGRLFDDDDDYLAFERVIARTHALLPMRILAYCLMPNHWHVVLWPRTDGQLSEFMRLLTVTHTQRWHAHHHSAGTGPLYQGRFKSFPIQQDDHLLTVCRYVERNPLRANLVRSITRWPHSSLAKRAATSSSASSSSSWLLQVNDWPVEPPRNWIGWVNRAQTPSEVEALRRSIKRGQPFGDARWQERIAKRLSLESTLRPRGRPRVRPNKDSRPL